MTKSGVYMLTNGNLIEVRFWDNPLTGLWVDVSFFNDGHQMRPWEMHYLFSGAEYLGEL